jgi:hypothetical protein
MGDENNHPVTGWTKLWQTQSHGNTGPASYNVINIAREEVHMHNAWMSEMDEVLRLP